MTKNPENESPFTYARKTQKLSYSTENYLLQNLEITIFLFTDHRNMTPHETLLNNVPRKEFSVHRSRLLYI